MSMRRMFAIAAAAVLAAAVPAEASDPFSDVPLNHWAYDALEDLAAKGVLEGYPDNTFRGRKAMTRYEIAAMAARMMGSENLSNEDIDKLKSLVSEFAPELEAIGVKADSFNSRLVSLEEGLKGWKIMAQMRYDYKAFDYRGDAKTLDSGNRRTGFSTDRARFYVHRGLSQGVSFDMRWNRDNIDRFWLTAKDFMGVEGLQLRFGSFYVDWDGDDDMYSVAMSGGASWITESTFRGAEIKYGNGYFEILGLAASDNDGWSIYDENESSDIYGGRIKVNFGKGFWMSLSALGYSIDDQEAYEGTNAAGENSYVSYWVNLGLSLAPGVELKGSYFIQDWDEAVSIADGIEDSPSAYRVIFDIDQSVLKFTSLWAQYSHYDAGFTVDNLDYSFETYVYTANDIYDTSDDQVFQRDHDIVFAYLKQQWTPKLSTFEEFQYADADSAADATRWAVGIGYQYTPALYFEVAYSMQDGHCNEAKDNSGYEDNILRIRTFVYY